MLKRVLAALAVVSLLACMTACGSKEFTCDGCGKTVKVSANTNMEEDWIIFCKECAPDIDY